MPKNNKTYVTQSTCAYFDCGCGFAKEFNDTKSMLSGMKRHKRVCETAKRADWKQGSFYEDFFDDNTGKRKITDIPFHKRNVDIIVPK